MAQRSSLSRQWAAVVVSALLLWALLAGAAPPGDTTTPDIALEADPLRRPKTLGSHALLSKRLVPGMTSSNPTYRVISAVEAAQRELKGTNARGRFFRGDSRPPEVIFARGFEAKGVNLNLNDHFSPGFGPPSGFVSLSRSRTAAKEFAAGHANVQTGARHVYVITPEAVPDGYWMPEVEWRMKLSESARDRIARELEFAGGGPIPPAAIAGVYEKPDGAARWRWRPNPRAKTNLSPTFRSLWCASVKRAECDLVEPGDGQDSVSDLEDQSNPPSDEDSSEGAEAGEQLNAVATTEAKPAVNEFGIVTVAESVSRQEFIELAGKLGVTKTVEAEWKMSLPEVRSRLLNYKQLAPGTPKFSRLAPTVGYGGLAAAGVGVWIRGVVNAFTADVNGLDRTAAVASLIPLVGCIAQAAADIHRGQPNELDTALCLLGDALLLSASSAPLGILVHFTRILLVAFEPPPVMPPKEEYRRLRDKPWFAFLDGELTSWFSSTSFRTKLSSYLAMEALVIASEGAQVIGALNATDRLVLAREPLVSISVKRDIAKAIHQIKEGVSDEVRRRQRNFLLRLPKALRDDREISMKAVALKYNEDFIDKATSEKAMEKYTSLTWMQVVVSPSAPGRLRVQVALRMRDVAVYLRQNPPPLPSLFILAYFVGVAAGVAAGVEDPPKPRVVRPDLPGFARFAPADPADWTTAVDPRVLDPAAYYLDKVGRNDSRVLVEHTLAVSRLFLNKISEDQLPQEAQGLEPSEVGEFQMLIAMNIGRVFANWKQVRGSSVGFIHEDIAKSEAETLGRVMGLSKDSASALLRDVYRVRRHRWQGMSPVFSRLGARSDPARTTEAPVSSE